MATAFTHAFVAASLGAVARSPVPRAKLIAAFVVLAVLPDLDVVFHAFGVPYRHPIGHRGLTHSLPFAVLVGAATASLVFREVELWSPGWWRLTALLAVATASHGILDAFTDAGHGIGFFVPFSSERWFFPWRPLATSPLGITAFFRGPAITILWNEVRWVWLPVSVLAAFTYVMSRRRSR